MAWARRYRDLIEALPKIVAEAPLTLCGMNACIDARVSMHDMPALLHVEEGPAAAFAAKLVARASQGIGGEFAVDWPGGPAWLAAHVPVRYALGGTGPHTANVLTTLGAPAVLCLRDRSAHMLAHVPPGVLLVADDRLVPVETLTPHGERQPEIFIFEYTAGVPIGAVVPDRSSRIIVRFHNPGLENDLAFDALTPALAARAGTGLVSGFNAVPSSDLDRDLARVFGLTRSWLSAGLKTVHLELAGYDSLALLESVLAAARGAIISIGMSHSELQTIDGTADPPVTAMMRLGKRIGCRRVCVHADHWAASVTRDDPEREEQALMLGCLLASARAATGHPVRPVEIEANAAFHPLPFPTGAQEDSWSFVACASPYLERPATTLGLGDTFTAGCLLALGQAACSDHLQHRAKKA